MKTLRAAPRSLKTASACEDLPANARPAVESVACSSWLRRCRAGLVVVATLAFFSGLGTGAETAAGAAGTPAEEQPTLRPFAPPGTTTSPANGAETTAALKALADRLTALEATLAKVRDDLRAQDKSAVDLKAAVVAVESSLAGVRGDLQRVPTTDQIAAATKNVELQRRIDKIVEDVDSIRKLVTPPGAPTEQAPDYARFAMIAALVAAALALVAVVSVVVLRPGRGSLGAAMGAQRQLNGLKDELLQEMAKIAAAAKPDGTAPAALKDAVGAINTSISALRAQCESAGKERMAIDVALDRLDEAGARLQPAVQSLGDRLKEIEDARTALAAEKAEFDAQKLAVATARASQAQAETQAKQAAQSTTDRLQQIEARLGEYEKLLPAALKGDGALASWRSRILVAAGAGQGEAATLLAALIRWQIVVGAPQRDRDRWLEVTEAVGRACHAYLATVAAESDAEVLERLQTWTRAFKTPFEEAFPSLKLNAAYPGDRFDTDRMEAVSSNSGSRQIVHHPLSWFVLEKAGETTRVLKRALVVTA